MKNLYIFFLAIMITGCATNKKIITSHTASGIDFNRYHTYSFLRTADTSYTKQGINRSKFAHSFVLETVNQLTKRGMSVDTLHPDCYFRYKLKVSTSYEVGNYANIAYSDQTYNDDVKPETEKLYIFNANNKPMVYGETVNIDTLKEGSLVIEMIDAKTDSIVWYAKSEGKQDVRDIDHSKNKMNVVVPKMFKRFPK